MNSDTNRYKQIKNSEFLIRDGEKKFSIASSVSRVQATTNEKKIKKNNNTSLEKTATSEEDRALFFTGNNSKLKKS